jgi:hypothetical protein
MMVVPLMEGKGSERHGERLDRRKSGTTQQSAFEMVGVALLVVSTNSGHRSTSLHALP